MKKLVFLLVLSIVFECGGMAFADARSDYDNYVSTYKAYRTAVNEGRSKAEVSALLESYKSAKAAYENSVNLGKPEAKAYEVPTSSAPWRAISSGAPAVSASVSGAAADNEEPAAEYSSIAIDSELKKLVDDLWSEEGRKSPDSRMQALVAYLSKNPVGENADVARYELAKAYELLKEDITTSTNLLKQIGVSGAGGRIASLAAERIKYLEAGVRNVEWKQALNNTYGAVKEKYVSYDSSSWLAFPVKIGRWAGYAGKMFSFNKTQDEYEKFMVWYEDMGAKFAPPVEIAFDNFKPAYTGKTGKIEDSLVVLHYDNPSSWYARWKVINDARESIDLQYFIMDDDIFGYSLLGLIYKKVLEGVRVRVLLDARGTKKLTRRIFTQDILQEMSQYKNAEIKVFSPVLDNLASMFSDLRKIISSNHDKIIVVDNEYSIIGGRNVSKDYYLDSSDHSGAYRDCDVLIKDVTVAKELRSAFEEEFDGLKTESVRKDLINLISQEDKLNAAHDAMDHYLVGQILSPRSTDSSKYKKFLSENVSELKNYKKLSGYADYELYDRAVMAPVKIIDKHSLHGPRNDITEQVIKYIDGSKREVMIQNPYVVLSERMFAALKRADKRGIPVIMHTNSPASTDSLATQAMFYADWKKIFEEIPGIKIYVYTGSNKLHAKNWVFDRKIGVVGTYNLDYMSEQINSEVVAAVKSDEFSKQLRTGILSDISKSVQYKYGTNERGEFESVGPDDYQGKNFWLLKTLSKLDFLKIFI